MSQSNLSLATEPLSRDHSVLNVAQSVLGKRWNFSGGDTRLAQGISQAFGLPEIVGRILTARGVKFDDVAVFLNPALKTQLPDPSTLKDMDKAAARIAAAIRNREKVAVFGDYDVDGATSSALLKRFFKALNCPLRIYIPDRIKEGYGPNAPALLKLKDEGISLVVTVDCGSTAFDALEAGSDAGLEIIVLDHHRAEAAQPRAYAVVNPNRLDDTSGQGHMAAVGVTFLTIVAVNRILRDSGFYTDQCPEPRILNWLDIVALGTVCDVVPLTGVNRAFVAQGLKVMAMRQNAGLAALADIAAISESPNSFHAGFVFGPRVNAGGRVGESDLGAKILSTDDPLEARDLAKKLNQYNIERKELETAVLEEATGIVELGKDQDTVLMVSGDGWHSGVIGIVAARLKEKYNRPTCVIGFDENGIGKASGRSVNAVDLGAAVSAAKQAGLLIAGGGHKMAAGFSVARDNLDALVEFVNVHIREQLNGQAYTPELRIDGVLSLHSLTMDLVNKINMLAPYGAGHAEPRFALTNIKVIKPRVVGENHVSCFIQDTSGGASLKAIAFRAMDSALGEMLLKSGTAPLNLAGQISVNEWNGKKTIDFQIIDAAPVWA
jgi:single-stranded-DNA-specific exonuclease